MQDAGDEEGAGVDGGARDSLVERLFALAAKQGTGGVPGTFCTKRTKLKVSRPFT